MKILRLSLIAILAGTLLLGTAAWADVADVFAGVFVWNGNLPSQSADLTAANNLAATMQPPTYFFTYNGPINFVNNNPNGASNTFGEFFGSNISGIGGLSPADLANFENATMSTPGTDLETLMLFEIIQFPTTGPNGTLQHDDGASLYLCDASPCSAIAESPAWTSLASTPFTLPAGTHNYALVYVEGNGSPSDLIMTTPEPSSLMLLGVGLAGLAGALRRKLPR